MSEEKEKPRRRLPVLQQAPAGEEPPPEERPGSQWAFAAGIITILLWLLLGGMTNMILQRLHVEAPGPLVLGNLAAFFLAAALAGLTTAIVGVKASRKHALYGALGAGAFGWAISFGRMGDVALPFQLVVLAVLLAIPWAGGALGYWLGKRLRRQSKR